MRDTMERTRGWMIDVDGCLVSTKRAGGAGGEPMRLAGEMIGALYDRGDAVVVCTNASQSTPEEYAEHLRSIGIPVRDGDFMTAGSAAAEFIAYEHPGARVLVLGEHGLTAPLRGHDVELIGPEDGLADAVIVGAAGEYSGADLNAAALAVDAGAPLYTTVDVPWFHGGRGKAACLSAAIAHAIGWVTGATPIVLGKPSDALGQTLLRRLALPPHEITVVGDATVEIDLARRMGANAALVLSGGTDQRTLESLTGRDRPDDVFTDVGEIFELLFPHLSTKQGAHE